MSEKANSSIVNFAIDFAAGGISGAVAKTATAPIERVKLIIQTQDANPLIKSGQVARYTGIGNCFMRVYQEQGLKAFWRGNFTNVIRYFPTQAFNFAFKDTIKALFPKYSSKTDFFMFFMVNMASGGLAGAGSLCIVYPLDYARTRLASDVGAGQKSFNGLADCLMKTAKGPSGIMGLYNGFGVSVAGIIPYRGVYFGMYDSLAGINPFKKGKHLVNIYVPFFNFSLFYFQIKALLAWLRNSPSLKPPQLLPAMRRILSTPFEDAYRCNLRSLSLSGSTRALLTASLRSRRRKA